MRRASLANANRSIFARRMLGALALCATGAAVVAACGEEAPTSTPSTDSGADDGADSGIDTAIDAGRADSGRADGDTGAVDTYPLDSAPGDTGGLDTGPADTGASDTGSGDTPSDTGIVDAGPGDGAPADMGPGDSGPADTGCGSVATTAFDVYVDAASIMPSAGTLACPFKTIREATELSFVGSGTRTIHVKANASPYAEIGILRVRASVKLVGDGAATTRVTGGSTVTACSGPPVGTATPCLVYVEPGGSLEGFTVQFTASTTSGDDIVMGDGSGAAPIVKNVTATKAPRNGIFTLGAADVGPGVHCDYNGSSGLSSTGLTTVALRVYGSTNSFDHNAFGLGVLGAALLTFEGGTASFNSVHGFAISGPTGTGAHSVDKLVASDNLYAGMQVSSQANVVVRNSTFQRNDSGVVFYQGTTNKLDLGTTVASGNNVLAGATTADRNKRNGLCISGAKGTGTAQAVGNKWSVCPVVQVGLATCDVAGVHDAAYAPATSGPDPAVASGCLLGP